MDADATVLLLLVSTLVLLEANFNTHLVHRAADPAGSESMQTSRRIAQGNTSLPQGTTEEIT